MTLDTSAISEPVAGAPDAAHRRFSLSAAGIPPVPAAAVVETRIAPPGRFGARSFEVSETWLEQSSDAAVSFDADQAAATFPALHRYAKGQKHSARLPIRPCIAYALPKLRGNTLLLRGQDFARTDAPAPWRSARPLSNRMR